MQIRLKAADPESVTRFWEREDLGEFFRRFPNPGVMTLEQLNALCSQLHLIMADDEPRGIISLTAVDMVSRNAHFGIAVLPGPDRREVAVEATAQLFAYCYDYLGLEKVSAQTLAERSALGAFLESWGFQREATLRRNIYYKGEFRDEAVYSLLSSEYLAARAARESGVRYGN